MTWIFLFLGGVFEVVWATTMKLSNGFTNIWYSLYTVIGMIFSFGFLALAVKHIPLSISYPVWTGIGAVGSIIIGVVLFKDHLSFATWIFVAMLIVGIIGIKVTSGH
ncbi:DMT family transporter [Enterococcus mediterraneensis]|uniref:DMT family transporter n=1 Tax=Enterococcus mediterraneensis TaxID=2364791 RepID=UPI000F04E477|nr:multidrug efflux SMR transporter [Enterococcus mediterraneensis]